MSFEALAPPAPGEVTAIVPGPDDDAAAALSPVLAAAAAAGRAHRVVPAAVVGARDLTTAINLRVAGTVPTGPAREAWLRPLPELVARLERPWRELGHAERYLAGVARARLAAVDLIVLELPAGRLPGPRVVQLIRDLSGEGTGVLWLERRLHLVAEFAIPVWLLDAGVLVGPLEAATLARDERARRLALGGRLAPR